MASNGSTISKENFKTPDMGEYQDIDLVEELLKSINGSTARDAAYYVEEPFSSTLGYHEEYGAFIVSALPVIEKYNGEEGRRMEELNTIDGDTISFNLETVNDGGHPFTINGVKYKSFQDYCYANTTMSSMKEKVFKIRSVGIDAPEIPHYNVVTVKASDYEKNKILLTPAEMRERGDSIAYERLAKRSEDEQYEFIKVDGTKYYEVISVSKEPIFKDTEETKVIQQIIGDMETAGENVDIIYAKIVSKDEQTSKDMDSDGENMGLVARDAMLYLLNNATDFRIVVDAKQVVKSGYSETYKILTEGYNGDKDMWELVQAFCKSCFSDYMYKYTGFTTFGQDAYKRFLGALYVKIKLDGANESLWVNASKYIISKCRGYIDFKKGTSPADMAANAGVSDAFKVWSYDNTKSKIADGFYNISKDDFDDRRAIQKELTSYDFSCYRDFTVMIGDCLFMVPPTSIRVVSQIESERVNLLRSKGSITKTLPHVDRIIELTLYFNGEHGINGYPIKKQTPRQVGTDEWTTYYMNGLRSLIAMFKYTPFLPIENAYINDVLNIEAVSLANLQMQTMPMYPNCIAVTLTLQQFNYRIYMNELPLPNPEEGQSFNTNMFARTINYEVMRYYYQRAIHNGENIKELSATDQEYIEKTIGSQTALIPMQFKDQTIQFYTLEKAWLDKMLEVKTLSETRPLQQTVDINEKTTAWARQVGISLSYIMKELKSWNYKRNDTVLNDQQVSMPIQDYKVQELIKDYVLSKKCPYLDGVFRTYSSGYDVYNFTFNTDSLTKSEIRNLIKIVSKEIGDDGAASLLVDGSITFKFKEISNDYTMELETDSSAWKLAEFFAYRSGMISELENMDINNENWENFSAYANEKYFKEVKSEAIDIETMYSAKFVPYPIDDLVVQNFSISMGNIFAKTRLKVQEGYAPQYAGGQDTVIEFLFHTKNENTVNAINAMQSIAAEQLVTYKKIIKCWPVRIGSEMTRLCGINEVSIESVDISTVPMQPGLYAIQVRALSMDRTMRNRESLRRLDAINNAGTINKDGISSYINKTYFDLNNTLAKAEVYPDLELPTINELEEQGFKFIRYTKSKNARSYPDPDFYFVYGYAYASQMLRKVITDYFKSNGANDNNPDATSEIYNSKTVLMDSASNQEITVKGVAGDEVLTYEYSNPSAAKLINDARNNLTKKIEEAKKADENKKLYEEYQDLIEPYDKSYEKCLQIEDDLITFYSPTINVCKAIKCTLKESAEVEQRNAVDGELERVKKEIISHIDRLLEAPISVDKKWKSYASTITNETYVEKIPDLVKTNLNGNGENAMKTLNEIISIMTGGAKLKDCLSDIKGIFAAAAMAMSSKMEYDDKVEKRNYYATGRVTTGEKDSYAGEYIYIPYAIISDDVTGITQQATSLEEGVKYGVRFGPFQTRMFDKEFLTTFYSDETLSFSGNGFIDPYYNKTLNPNLEDEKLKEYKEGILTQPGYALEAFTREVLVWMKHLIQKDILISYYDIHRDDFIEEIQKIADNDLNYKDSIHNASMGYGGETTGPDGKTWYYFDGIAYPEEEYRKKLAEKGIVDATNEYLEVVADYGKSLKEMIEKYDSCLTAGKLFSAVILCVTQGDSSVYNAFLSKDVATIQNKILTYKTSVSDSEEHTDGERRFRKLIRALAAPNVDVMKNIDAIGASTQTKIEEIIAERTQKLWLDACQEPASWVLHSYYDMVVNNKRGRMARAFPTYYMLLIDEGREIGYWKLHDNFYNTSSIGEIEVIKSRKIAADTARITMTNMYKTFTSDDEDIKVDYEHNLRDVFNSIFSPRVYFQEQEEERMQQLENNRITLKPGARVHLRMGYSGDASNLPILFNGVIAEVNPGEVIEIIAQGDGHELANPGVFAGTTATDLADLTNESSGWKWITNFFTEGATPKKLIQNVLTTKSGVIGKYVNKFTNGRFFNDNAFGISHFGEIDYIDIHKNGEIMQNIYEGEGGMPWNKNIITGSTADAYHLPDAPYFTVELKDKSVWDLLHVCASTSLEFITGISTFGLRSTIFHGRPHYYYAYDYELTPSGKIVERRKPYQQYHIIDSYSDIIENSIKANGRDIRTVAVPIYKGPNGFGKSVEKKLPSPLWVDWDIYPEYQKSMVVNTQMTFKANALGILVFNKFYDEWSKNGGQKIAWRMGAMALKDSIKDMYEGEVSIIGDTSIKPQDRIYLHDIYEDMSGMFEVEAVVHSMSPETGFVTSVYPDCISAVDSRFEELGRMWSTKLATELCVAKGATWVSHKVFGTTTKPILNTMAKLFNKSVYTATEYVNKAASLVGYDELIRYSKLESWQGQLVSALGMSNSNFNIWSTLEDFNDIAKAASKVSLDDLTTSKNLIASLSKMFDSTRVGADDLVDMLEGAIKSGKIKASQIKSVEDSIENLKALNKVVEPSKELAKTISSIADEAIEQLKKMDKLDDTAKAALEVLTKHKSPTMNKASMQAVLKSLDDVSDIIKLSDKADDVVKCSVKIADAITDTNKIVKNGKLASSVVTSTLTTTGAVASIVAAAAEMAIIYVLTKSVYNKIENIMASLNVLTIYPLQKTGIAYVAGIDGHKGLVVGSTTWESEGLADKFIEWAFDGNGAIKQFFKLFVYSEQMNEIAEMYKTRNKIGAETDVEATDSTINGLMKAMAESQASNYSNYVSMVIANRITNMSDYNAKLTYGKTRIIEMSNDAIKNELVPITQENVSLEKYFREKKLITLGSRKEKGAQYKEFNLDTEACGETSFNALISTKTMTNKSGERYDATLYNIPFLRPDAYQVLVKIIEKTLDKAKDSMYGDEKTAQIWLKSATVVGDNTWAATGYMFRVEVLGTFDGLADVLEEIKADFRDLYVSENTENIFELIQYKQVKGDGKVYEVFIAPRDESQYKISIY